MSTVKISNIPNEISKLTDDCLFEMSAPTDAVDNTEYATCKVTLGKIKDYITPQGDDDCWSNNARTSTKSKTFTKESTYFKSNVEIDNSGDAKPYLKVTGNTTLANLTATTANINDALTATTINTDTISKKSASSTSVITIGSNVSLTGSLTATENITCTKLTASTEINTSAIKYTDKLYFGETSNNVYVSGKEIYATTFNGTATAARWSDLAEYYEVDDSTLDAGTIVDFSGEKQVSIAKTNACAVISDKPGFIMNKTDDPQFKPLVLVGKTPVKIAGKIRKFDRIVLSKIPGIGRRMTFIDKILCHKVLGIALESKESNDIALVSSIVQLNIR